MMGAAGDDEDGHWRNEFQAEPHRRPRVMELSTPLQASEKEEELDYGVARPQADGLGLPAIGDTGRSPTGSAPLAFASRNILTAVDVVALMQ